MKRNYQLLYVLPFLFAALGSCQRSTEKSRIPKQYSAEQLRNNVNVFGSGFNADESGVLLSSNVTGIYNVYQINMADSASMPLTQSGKESFFSVDYLPGQDAFIYSADDNGDENNHLYLSKQGSNIPKDITPWPGSKNNFLGWSEDKKAMYVVSNKRDSKVFDLWKLDTLQWEPVLLFKNDQAYNISSVSKSERYVALGKSITTDKEDLYLFDRTNKSIKAISNDHEAVWYASGFEKNDSTLYYITNDGAEFAYLVRYNMASGKGQKMFETKWDVVGFRLSENEKYHTIYINEDGKNKVLLFDHATIKPVNFPDIKGGEIQDVTISRSEKNFLLTIGSSTSPSNLYVYNAQAKNVKQLTSTLNKAVDQHDLVPAEVVRFTSFDGRKIPAIYYRPLQADRDHPVPALVWVHGGPGGQSHADFSNSIQFLVNHGYAVLAVNNRGSSGYGKEFYKLDNKDHGYGDLKDCIWGKKWLSQQAYIDSNAIGILGGSYGGTMVLNALSLHPDEFKVGVNLFGVGNWLRTLRSIPPYWESAKKALYDEMGDPDSKDSVMLKNTSPLYNYMKIKKPLIVFQGANDVRVMQIESDEIVAGVKKNGVPVEYVIYPDEGHGFVKKKNQITTDSRTLAFLDKYLKFGEKKQVAK